jgi:23S rRNA pseudouridine2457 synthase
MNNLTLENIKEKLIIEGRKTLPARAKLLITPPEVPERIPPIRERKTIPVSWITLSLVEGKNRQVRKMTASAGHPTLRLIRIRIGKILLGNMKPGEVREITPGKDGIFRLLK